MVDEDVGSEVISVCVHKGPGTGLLSPSYIEYFLGRSP